MRCTLRGPVRHFCEQVSPEHERMIVPWRKDFSRYPLKYFAFLFLGKKLATRLSHETKNLGSEDSRLFWSKKVCGFRSCRLSCKGVERREEESRSKKRKSILDTKTIRVSGLSIREKGTAFRSIPSCLLK